MTAIRRSMPLLAMLVLLATTGCDSCAGTGLCAEPHLAMEGLVSAFETGGPVANVAVHFVWTGGVEPRAHRIVTTTDAEGRFRFREPTLSEGQVMGALELYPIDPPYAGYYHVYQPLWVATTSVRGDTRWVGIWGVGPLPGSE